ncbi:MAG TPA: DUF835 domain-containing protein [Thermoplasmata archaeon]|nr:DUF835 domain-containing protein [Thermoplasmata archaeon]
MAEIIDFAMETLPRVIGLALILYAVFRIKRAEMDFFQASRSWVLNAFMICLALLWIFELLGEVSEEWFAQNHAYVALSFVIVAMWLSTFMVALSTEYKRYNSIDQMARWLRNTPVNVITLWGAIAIGALLPVWFTDLSPTGWKSENDWVLALVFVYVAISLAIDTVFIVRASPKGMLPRLAKESRREMVLLSIGWTGIPLTSYFLDSVLDFKLGIEDYNPYSWIMVFLFALIVETISGKGFTGLIVDSEVEDGKRSGFRVYDIPRGVYLVEDEKPAPAFSLFSELVALPLSPNATIPDRADSASATLEYLIPQGLVVTREFPESIRKAHNLQVTPIIWLTESPGDMRIAPTSLAVLTDTIVRFMENNPNSIVLIEGIEYMVTFNDFRKVLRQLDSLNETAWVTKGRLLLSVDPRAFDERELAMLERDRKVVKHAAGIEELKKESRIEA